MKGHVIEIKRSFESIWACPHYIEVQTHILNARGYFLIWVGLTLGQEGLVHVF